MKHSVYLLILSLIFIPACSFWGTKKTSTESKTTMSLQTTPSGLRYEILKPATDANAAQPQKNQRVTVHYTGWLNNNDQEGKKFDSSVDRGQPFTFVIGIGHVIQGWDEGVMGMKVGEKRRLYIPSNLGYGSRGAGNVIPANADLIFDVELISTK